MIINRFTITAASGAAAAVALFSVANAATYDPNSGFSIASNPHGVYSYGYENTLGGSLTLFTTPAIITGGEKWTSPAVDPYLGVYHGTAGSGNLGFHPGPATQDAVLRLTLPTGGLFSVNGGFINEDAATTDVHILFDGVSAYDSVINSGQMKDTFTVTHTFAPGDTIDFVVGNGGDGFYHDSTGLTALVSGAAGGVPEPASWALMLIGFGALGAVARCRRGDQITTA